MQEIVQALKENKFIALTFTLNGDRIQVCGTARAEKGKIAEPMNLLVSAEELDGALNAMFGCWCKGKKKEEKKAEVAETETDPKERETEETEETEKTDLNVGGNADAAAEEEPKAEPETETDPKERETEETEPATHSRAEEDEWE